MDAERGLIGKILLDDGFVDAQDYRVTTELFESKKYRAVFKFIKEFYEKYGEIPSVELIEEEFPEVDIPYAKEPAGYYIDKMRERHIRNKGAEILTSKAPLLVQNPIDGILSIREAVANLSIVANPTSDSEWGENVEERIKQYLAKKEMEGVTGYHTPWKPLDIMTSGIHAKEFICVVARPKTGKCVSGESRVPLPDGRVVKMKDFVENEENKVLSLDEDSGKLVESNVNGWLDTGIKEGYRVRTARGREVTVTSCHPFLTQDGWKSIDDGLDVLDSVALPKSYEGLVSGDKKLPVEEIELIALMLTDGCMRGNTPMFSTDDTEILEMADRIARHFDVEVKHRENYDYVFSGSKGRKNPVRAYLAELDMWGKYSYQKVIPDVIYQLRPELLKRFLEVVLSCDGGVCEYYYEYSSTSKELAYGLQHLMLRFGVSSRLRVKPTTHRDAYILAIRGENVLTLLDKFSLIERKSKLLHENVGTKTPHGTAVSISEELIDKIREKAYGKGKELGKLVGQKRFNYSKNRLMQRGLTPERCKLLGDYLGIPELSKIYNEDVLYDKIVSIEPVGKVHMYDLEIDGTHNFIVNDILVHNTFLLIILALAMWKQGLSVMFISTEMSKMKISQRLDAVNFELPYQEFKTGVLPDAFEERYKREIKKLKDKEPIHIVEDVDGVSSIGAKIDQYEPDVVFLDGMYLLNDDKGARSTWERVKNISNDLRKLAKTKNVPLVTSTQFNRGAENVDFKDVTLAQIGYADSIGQDAELVLGMFQNKDMRSNREMLIRTMAFREGEPVDFTIQWDLHNMDFKVLEVDDEDEYIDPEEFEEPPVDF